MLVKNMYHVDIFGPSFSQKSTFQFQTQAVIWPMSTSNPSQHQFELFDDICQKSRFQELVRSGWNFAFYVFLGRGFRNKSFSSVGSNWNLGPDSQFGFDDSILFSSWCWSRICITLLCLDISIGPKSTFLFSTQAVIWLVLTSNPSQHRFELFDHISQKSRFQELIRSGWKFVS